VRRADKTTKQIDGKLTPDAAISRAIMNSLGYEFEQWVVKLQDKESYAPGFWLPDRTTFDEVCAIVTEERTEEDGVHC
jgi:hypothetical protein